MFFLKNWIDCAKSRVGSSPGEEKIRVQKEETADQSSIAEPGGGSLTEPKDRRAFFWPPESRCLTCKTILAYLVTARQWSFCHPGPPWFSTQCDLVCQSSTWLFCSQSCVPRPAPLALPPNSSFQAERTRLSDHMFLCTAPWPMCPSWYSEACSHCEQQTQYSVCNRDGTLVTWKNASPVLQHQCCCPAGVQGWWGHRQLLRVLD